MAPDGSGNLYIVDSANQRIRKVDAAGVITTVAGDGTQGYGGDGGPATAAQLYFPNGVALDGSGNLYFADRDNQRIRKVDSSGNISTVAGTGTEGFSGTAPRPLRRNWAGPQVWRWTERATCTSPIPETIVSAA